MKARQRSFTVFVTLWLVASATADVIYSGLQDTPIPTGGNTGLFIDVDGNSSWDLNPFYGGVGVANSPALQPARINDTGYLAALQDFIVGDTIDINKYYAADYGGSETHLNTTFTAGQPEYLGFKLDTNNNPSDPSWTYGWMRVVFTNNASGAMVKDWAYDTSGAPIVVGQVQESIVDSSHRLMTLSPGTGKSFTLGSLITNASGNTSVFKTGAGTTILKGVHTYSGTTTIHGGSLKLDGVGSLGNSTDIIVGDAGSSGAVLDATTRTGGLVIGIGQTISGIGEIQGSTTIQLGGTLTPGHGGAGVLHNQGNIDLKTGSTFVLELNGNTAGTQYNQLNVTGSVTLGGLLSLRVNFMPTNNSLFFIIANNGGSSISGAFSNASLDGGTYTFDGHEFKVSYQANAATSTFTGGNDVALMVVPEPTAALLGGIGLLLILRRRRDP
ncbi:MAG: autotransporter-associated beta strand repeat-containing protein [Verrucomicrobiota bacterium]